jgi:thioredoxin 1
MSVIHLTNQNFDEEVLQSALPVLVDFWAEWCGPCKMIAPVVEELGGELAGQMKVAKVNVDEAQELAARYNIMSIPTLLVFKNGKQVNQIVGALGKDQLLQKIKPQLEA